MVEIWILPFSLLGLAVSWFIYHKKNRKKEKMVCYIGTDCDKVIHSRYSSVLGVPLEVLGVAYYLFLSLMVIATHLGSFTLFGFMIFDIVLIFSITAFVFSLYLTYIQGFVIRDWCEFCLISAFMSTIIFLIEVL
ncbi:MAG TPA: vitamin K epoxide reductase family protein [Candidatus Paceibacterota bacterium]|jgi:uncharacterized membrane protein|nr:vitamin K epoxide reductase family protein [Candidatus Paceibacterota bacterium]|tara:strand:- start:542 stop:946 length:405 start_codon:yes stop_codon:yes gene_type:complete